MKQRSLHVLKTPVSEIGFGTWGLGGEAYGPIDRSAALALLRRARDKGVTFYDTADLYGAGRAEEILGEAFRDCRKELVIASKVGFLPDGRSQDFSAPYLRRSMESSLRRLCTDYIDLYLLHSPALEMINDELLRELESLKTSGKALAVGISVRSPADALPAIERHGFRCVEVNFNLIDQRPLDVGLFELALRRGVGIIARTPFCFGFLTDRYRDINSFGRLDHRSARPRESLERWVKAPELFAGLYRKDGRTPVEAALQYCLAFEAVSSVIPGIMSAAQLDEDIAAGASKRLAEEDLAAIRDIYLRHFAEPGG